MVTEDGCEEDDGDAVGLVDVAGGVSGVEERDSFGLEGYRLVVVECEAFGVQVSQVAGGEGEELVHQYWRF